MCECDKVIGTRFLSHQITKTVNPDSLDDMPVTIGFQDSICNTCRGLKEKSFPKKAMYGRTSNIHRYYWREICFETIILFSEKYNFPDNMVVTEMAIHKKDSDEIEKEAVKRISEIHERSPKYIYNENQSYDTVLKEYHIENINIIANYAKSGDRKAKIEENGIFYTVEDYSVYCEALGLIPRRLRRNSKAFFINQYPAPWGGVVNYLKEKYNYDVIISESRPFHALFGTLMWLLIQDGTDEYCRMVMFGDRLAYENKTNAPDIYTTLPRDFGTPDYYKRRSSEIDKYFNFYLKGRDKEDLLFLFDLWVGPSYNLRQYLWAHREDDLKKSRKLIEIINTDTILGILKYLISDYWGRYLGWPDLIAYKNNEYKFYEVKSSKDKLSEEQVNWIKNNYTTLKLPFAIIKIHKSRH
jgi:hypothetical protein